MLETGRYARFELERRFLLDRIPGGVDEGALIVDRYITGARLRLRRVEGPQPQFKLSKKETPARPNYAVTVITTIYLSPEEYELMRLLPGRELRKRRHHLDPYSVDVFEGRLSGLIMAEIDFESEAEMRAHPVPEFAVREVSEDVRYTGAALAAKRLPA
jgi:CYTH domain-containing protein